MTSNPFANGKYNYEFEVDALGEHTTFFMQDPVFGNKTAYSVRTEDLGCGPSLQESIVQRLTHELDHRRRVLVGKLLMAEEASLLDEEAAHAVDTVLAVLQPHERYQRWRTPLDREKAENFKDLRELIGEPSYISWKMKLQLRGKKVVYTEMDWEIAKDCLRALAEVESKLPFRYAAPYMAEPYYIVNHNGDRIGEYGEYISYNI